MNLTPSFLARPDVRNYLLVLARQGLYGRVTQKVDASDVVQEVLASACRAHHQFEGESDRTRFAYLRSILANTIREIVRRFGANKRNINQEVDIDIVIDQSSHRLSRYVMETSMSPSDQAMRDEQMLFVAASLERLSDRYREAVELHYLHDLPFSEVAERMELNRDQTAGLIRRGMQALKKALKELAEESSDE